MTIPVYGLVFLGWTTTNTFLWYLFQYFILWINVVVLGFLLRRSSWKLRELLSFPYQQLLWFGVMGHIVIIVLFLGFILRSLDIDGVESLSDYQPLITLVVENWYLYAATWCIEVIYIMISLLQKHTTENKLQRQYKVFMRGCMRFEGEAIVGVFLYAILVLSTIVGIETEVLLTPLIGFFGLMIAKILAVIYFSVRTRNERNVVVIEN